MLACDHLFHQPCIEQWILKSKTSTYTCPLCRAVNEKEKCESCKKYLYISYKPFDCSHTYHYECGDYSTKCITCSNIQKKLTNQEKLNHYINETNKCALVHDEEISINQQPVVATEQSNVEELTSAEHHSKCNCNFDYERFLTYLCFPVVVFYVSYCEDHCSDLG